MCDPTWGWENCRRRSVPVGQRDITNTLRYADHIRSYVGLVVCGGFVVHTGTRRSSCVQFRVWDCVNTHRVEVGRCQGEHVVGSYVGSLVKKKKATDRRQCKVGRNVEGSPLVTVSNIHFKGALVINIHNGIIFSSITSGVIKYRI